MVYQVRIAGKIFQGDNPQTLLKRAVEAHKRGLRRRGSGEASLPERIHSQKREQFSAGAIR